MQLTTFACTKDTFFMLALVSGTEEFDPGESSRGEEQGNTNSPRSDNDEDELYDTASISESSNEIGTEHTAATHSEQADTAEGSLTDEENDMDPTPEDDDAEPHMAGQPNTGNMNPQPGPTPCTHSDLRVYAWNWSLIVYASSGIRRTCSTCGTQWTEAEFSSLLERSESGGADFNWQHISKIRWWPGGAWSWDSITD
jgi:hypothetical protein